MFDFVLAISFITKLSSVPINHAPKYFFDVEANQLPVCFEANLHVRMDAL